MFIAAMFTIAKLWKELRCPLINEWIKKMWFIYTIEYYSAIRKVEYLLFASTWLELEGIILSEISQAEKEEPSYTVGGNATWYNHFGKQCGGPLKN